MHCIFKAPLRLCTVAFILSALMVKAQTAPEIEWQKCLGGSESDLANSIVLTVDGGFAVAGSSTSSDGDIQGNHGMWDYLVMKLDALGNIEGEICLGGSEYDYGVFAQQTSDGGFIVAGESESNNGNVSGNHGGSDYWILKQAASGGIQWQKSLGGSDDEKAYWIQQTTDGGFVVAGSTYSSDGDVSVNQGSADCWIVKLTSSGDIAWEKSFGGSSQDGAISIQQTIDGGFAVAAYTYSSDGDVSGNHGEKDYWIVKLNGSGDIEWQKCLGGSNNDSPRSFQQTNDGGFVVAGSSESNDGDVSGNHGDEDYWIVKLDASGNIEWQKSLGGSDEDAGRWIQQTSDGGFVVAGYTESNDGDVSGNHGYRDCWIVKLDAEGSLERQKCLGGSAADYANAIQETTDGGFVVAGNTYSDDGDVSGNHGNADCWIVKLFPCDQLKIFYEDNDNDGYGDAGVSVTSSVCSIPAGYIVDSTDCDDTNSAINPIAPELCNNIDDNCNASIDEGIYSNFYADADGDGYGDINDIVSACSPLIGYVTDSTDCDDTNLLMHPTVAFIEWQKSFGGSSWDILESLQQTNDGGFVVAGFSKSNDGDVSGNHGDYDYWVVNLDSLGNSEWKKSLGGSDWEEAHDISQTSDGGYILAGWTYSNDGDVSGNHGYSDYWIVKLSSSGSIEWQKCLGGSFPDQAHAIIQTSDGGFAVSGESISQDGDVSTNHGSTDYWIVKLDAFGNIVWEKSLGGSYDEIAQDIQQTMDGGFVIAGSSRSSDGDVSGWHEGYSDSGYPIPDYWVVKLDPSGNIQWEKCLGGSETDLAAEIQQTVDGGFVIAGYTKSNDGDVSGWHVGYNSVGPISDYWIVKLDAAGNMEWQKCLGGTAYDEATSIQQTIDGGFAVTGTSYSNDGDISVTNGGNEYWVVKLLPSGNIDWEKCFGGGYNEYGKSILQTTDGKFVVAGSSISTDGDVTGNHGIYDYWIVKFDTDPHEICNGKDDNCNGLMDEGLLTMYYADTDGDGYGDVSNFLNSCDPANGYVANHSDCNDSITAINPGATEISNNGIDDDCDGEVDELATGIAMMNDKTMHLVVFPNPSPGHLTIRLTATGEQSLAIKMFDVLGSEVFSLNEKISGAFSKQLNLHHLPANTYFLKVILDGSIGVKKIVIEK